MNPGHLNRLWLVVGLALVFYSINSWVAGQGGTPILNMKLIDDRQVTSALIAIFVGTALLTLLCRIGVAFARMAPAKSGWHALMPVVGLDGLDTSSSEGKWYQRFFLGLFIGVPCAALVYSTDQVLCAQVFDREMPAALLGPLDPVPIGTILSAEYWHDRFRIGEEVTKAVTWFPVLEPFVIALLLFIAGLSVVLFLRALFSRGTAWRA